MHFCYGASVHPSVNVLFLNTMPTYAQQVWGDDEAYGKVFYARAIGEAPEMESSKATAKKLKGLVTAETRLLDVGCGSGHYLRTLRRECALSFNYQGVDITPQYIELAQKAFAKDSHAQFTVSPVESLPFPDQSFDVVMCCNVLLHLPSIEKPLQELWRVTKKNLLVRTLIGKGSFRIQQVHEAEDGAGGIFDERGEPRKFHYYNIYSESYIRALCSKFPDAKNITIEPDWDFDPSAFGEANWPDKSKPSDLTSTMNGWQLNGYVLQPWCFLQMDRA
jgi:SAM-dependent methyltransferase